jgi:DNA-binding transcriptional regulator YiaG
MTLAWPDTELSMEGGTRGSAVVSHQMRSLQQLRDHLELYSGLVEPSLAELQVDTGTRSMHVITFDEGATPTGVFTEFAPDAGALTADTWPRTRMGQIRELAPLSLRDWARVFGVTHSAIRGWEMHETTRPELDKVLSLLHEAGSRKPDVGGWLANPLPGTDTRPLDLLIAQRWQAFRGALRVRQIEPRITPEDLLRRRRESLDWAITEHPTVPEDE